MDVYAYIILYRINQRHLNAHAQEIKKKDL